MNRTGLKTTIFFVLISFRIITAQNISTLFVDTISIIVNNQPIYSSFETKLKFIKNNADASIVVFSDKNYKLEIRLSHSKTKKNSSLVLSTCRFFFNDTLFPLFHNGILTSYDDCSDLFTDKSQLQNWFYNQPEPSNKTKIKIHYRLFNYAPIDTINYKLNYRQGLWIGKGGDAEKILINYKNDKKDSIAKAIFKNGTAYRVNFKDNVADNYGMGTWENYKVSSYSIPNIVSQSCYEQQVVEVKKIILERNNKNKKIERFENISIYSKNRGLKNDSIDFNAIGDFICVNNDSIVLSAYSVSKHNFYRKYTEEEHFKTWFYKENQYVKFATKDIYKLYYTRQKIQNFTISTTLLSIVTALVVSPLVSIQKKGFNTQRLYQISGTSIGVMALSITLGASFNQKKFVISPQKEKDKYWKMKCE